MEDNLELDAAFVIHSRPYKEHSFLVNFLTLTNGRINAVAKSSRRQHSYMNASLQPYTPLKVRFKSGRGDLASLISCEPTGKKYALSVPDLFCADYLNELLYHLYKTAESSNSLFMSYIKALSDLADKKDAHTTLRSFETELLNILGYGLEFFFQEAGQKFEENNSYVFLPGNGFVESSDPAVVGEKICSEAIKGDILNILAQDRLSDAPEARHALRHLHQILIRHLLGGRELNSRNLYQMYLKQMRG